MKLAVRESGSVALIRWVADRQLISSAIARAETTRAIRRSGTRRPRSLNAVFDSVSFISCDDDVLSAAGVLDPPVMRTLDAIHIATALRFSGDLEAFVTYDTRQGDAASSAGLTVHAPR